MGRLTIAINALLGDDLTGVEIGTHKGVSASDLLRDCSIKRLYCIDPWFNNDYRHKRVTEGLSIYDNCLIMRMTSDEAVNEVPDDLDFVFIDGDHSYEQVLKDLQNWTPKIRSGGLLIGHDWCQFKMGVVIAGTEFFSKNDHLFLPPLSNEELQDAGLEGFAIAGTQPDGRNLINKSWSQYPYYFRIKA